MEKKILELMKKIGFSFEFRDKTSEEAVIEALVDTANSYYETRNGYFYGNQDAAAAAVVCTVFITKEVGKRFSYYDNLGFFPKEQLPNGLLRYLNLEQRQFVENLSYGTVQRERENRQPRGKWRDDEYGKGFET